VLVLIFFLTAVRRGHRNAEPDDSPPTAARSTRAVGAAVSATVLILLGLLVLSIFTARDISGLGVKTTREIEVIGHQWWWEVRYDSPRADKIAVGANEVHLPIGEPVTIRLTSRDVIHSLWIPNLHGKRDLIPGKEARIVMQADRAGIFRAQCAEFCGMQHAKMAFIVVVEPKENFERWLDRQRLPAPSPRTPDAQYGQQVFLLTTCAMCHTISGTTAGAKTGPDLTHIGSRRTLGAGIIPNTRGNLAGWIANAQTIKPGVVMPPNNLASKDLNALLVYLEGLK
jgi:cytochrome c oxidase subunit 2